jgi:ParB family chromosome partitioning protein
VKAEGRNFEGRDRRATAPEKDLEMERLESDFSAALGMPVRLSNLGNGNGEIRIRYRDLDELDRLIEKLAN